MKKLVLWAMALGLIACAASCQQEIIPDGMNGDAVVSLSVEVPQAATKAIGDGTNVDILYYEVWSDNNGALGTKTAACGTVARSNVAKTFDLELTLVSDQTYHFLFWAQVDGKDYYNTAELTDITVNYAGDANDESRTAFYAYRKFEVTGALNETIMLKRPFAQLNFGTSTLESSLGTVTVSTSEVTVKNPATKFNVATGKAAERAANGVTFAAAAIPTDPATLTVDGTGYHYLSMNYFLVAEGQETVDVDAAFVTDGLGTVNHSLTFVPVAQNYRTNIIGDLLFNKADFQIVVDERFEEPDLAPDPIYLAAAIGGEVTLTEDITITSPVKVQSTMVLNLNGKTITYTGDDVLFRVEGGNLTVNGTVDGSAVVTDPTTPGAGGNGYVGLVKEGGVLNINGGSYDAKGTCTIAQVTAGTLNVYGGEFKVNMNEYTDANGEARYLLNCSDTPYKNGEAVVNVYGGTFYKFNPANNAAEGAGTNFCAEGYKATKIDDNYVVSTEDVTVVADADGVTDALAAGEDVFMLNDIHTEAATTAPYGNKYAFKLDGGVIDGNGHELYMECYGDDYGIMTSGGTVKNLTITEGCRAIMIMYPTEDVILDNVNIGGDGVLYPINTGEAGSEGVNLIVTNSVLAGWTSFSNIESASFTNVEFKQGTYYNNIYGRVLKPYVNTTLTDCAFIEHMNLDLSGLISGHKVTMKNCTVNGQTVTADVFTVPTTDAEYDTELFTVDLPSWATSVTDCIVLE